MKEDTAHVEEENQATNDIMEVEVANNSATHVPKKDPMNNTVSEPAKDNIAIDPPTPPMTGTIETSTNAPEGCENALE